MHSIPGRRLILALFLVFLLLPIYWLINMSFKTNNEIVSTMTLWPHHPTLAHYTRFSPTKAGIPATSTRCNM